MGRFDMFLPREISGPARLKMGGQESTHHGVRKVHTLMLILGSIDPNNHYPDRSHLGALLPHDP